MSSSQEFQSVFGRLREMMLRHAGHYVIVHDAPGNLYIDTDRIMPNKKPLFFGSVQIKKNYVSYHLMPVYVRPALLSGISPALRKRMQGKSCFNFKALDEDLFVELESLTQSGVALYDDENFSI